MSKLTSRGDLLAGGGHTNDNRLAPTLVASLESGTHDIYVTSAIEGVVAAAVGELNELVNDTLALGEVVGVDEVSSTKLAGPLLLGRVDVNDDDFAGLVGESTLDDAETDASGAEDGNVATLFDLGGYGGGTVAGGDTAAEQAGAVHGGILLDGNNRDVGDDGVLAEGGGAHEVEDVLAAGTEAAGAIGHDAFALGCADLAAEVGLAGLAELALLALGGAVSSWVSG